MRMLPIEPTDATRFPAVAFLRCFIPGRRNARDSGEIGGTGTLIAPQLLLTAAHNLFDQATNSEATEVTAVFAGAEMQPQEVRAANWAFPPEWASLRDEVNLGDFSQYDVGVVRLDRPIDRFVSKVAYDKASDSMLAGMSMGLVGYPVDRLPLGARVGPMFGQAFGLSQGQLLPAELRQWEPFRLFYPVETSKGLSGCAIYNVASDGVATIRGVHTSTLTGLGFELGTALRIDDFIFRLIQNWERDLGRP